MIPTIFKYFEPILTFDIDVHLFNDQMSDLWFYNPPAPQARGGWKVIVQFSSYRLAKPLKPIFFPKVAKSEANWPISHRAQLGPRWPKSKSFKAQNQALAFSFQAKKRSGSIWLCYGWKIAIPWRWYEAKCHKMAPNFKSSYLGLGMAKLRSGIG